MSLSISLNKQPGMSYMPGETIKGVVTADMDENKTCDCITLTIQGKAVVMIRRRSSSSTVTFMAEEVYLSETIPLVPQATLPKGRTLFPFEYSLPTEGLPSTFKGTHGSINYEILVHMKRPFLKFDIRETLGFNISGVVDLNRISLDKYGPIQSTEDTPIGGCCCFTGCKTIRIEVTVPKRYFIPGEFIPFKMNIDNQSGTTLESGVMELVQVITFNAQGFVLSEEIVFGKMAGPEVKPNCVQPWEVEKFMIPVLKPVGIPPSGLGGCIIIDVQYILRYSATTDELCCGDRVKAVVPILIGTIALNA